MKKIRLFFTALAVLMASVAASAQTLEVHGVVSDEGTGEPVPFAAVRVVGTTVGATAGADGSYAIKVAADAKLEFSSVGYKSVTVPVSGRVVVNCELESDNVLEDVLVVAYGSVKREAVTGSVSSVKGETLASVPVTSVDKALSGKLAGVQVTATSGQPGASSQIRIRGISSINASNAPLWVVDGIPVISGDVSGMTNTSNALTILNPNDIESITVLKDAAAAAAYGSRAANGVILVTTKSGKEGKAQFDARVKFGMSWLQSDSGFRMMNAEELLSYQRDAIVNAGLNPDDPTGPYYRPMSILNGELTNWLDWNTRLGKLQEYEISARGGNAKAKYFASINYHKNEGIAYGIDYSKIAARINADYKLTKRLETGVRINAAYTDQNDVPMQSLYYANPIWAGETMLPWIPKFDENGRHNVNIPTNSYQNPRATAAYDEQWDKSYNFNGTMFLRWEPVKNLILETKNSAETKFSKSRRFWNYPLSYAKSTDKTLQTYRTELVQLTTSNTISYANVFAGYHSLRAVVGQEAQKYTYEYDYMYSPGVSADIPYHGTADDTKTGVGYGYTAETLLSFFGIADYNYDQRYFVQGTLRADGSSLFGSKNKWGLFWSVSGSWNISNENFLRDVKPVDLLKIRASYGVNGNNGIAAYKAYGLYSATQYNGTVGMLPSSPSNDVLSWEKNKTWDVGLDFGFVNRIHGQLDVYSRLTDDMLLNKKVPQTSGFSSNFMNCGSMKNTGVEFQFDVDIFNTPDFYWNIGFNIAHNKTKILDLDGEEKIEASSFVHYVKGKSMYTYYLPDYYGVNPTNGEALWVTEDGTLSNNYNRARKYYAGSPEPKFLGGFNTTLSWKGLQLSAFFEFKGGNYVCILNEGSYLNSDGKQMTMNQTAAALNYWKSPGDTGCNPKPIAGNSTNSSYALSDRWLERGDYLRIKDITLSYSLPKTALDKIHMKGFKIYVSGLNLYCFNDVYFWDPEIGVNGAGAGVYPLTKSFVGGIEISF